MKKKLYETIKLHCKRVVHWTNTLLKPCTLYWGLHQLSTTHLRQGKKTARTSENHIEN